MGGHTGESTIAFQDIMSYCPDNVAVFKEILDLIKTESNSIIPFVGAGLSAPIFPLWGDSLRQIANKFTNPANKEIVNGLIDRRDYLEAAQKLEDFRSAINLKKDFEEIFSNDKIAKYNRIKNMAVWIMPYLFKGMVVTTNLECVLEKVYSAHGDPFSEVFLPGERRETMMSNLRDPQSHYLYKFHGTIDGSGKLDYSNLVFTEAQYKSRYSSDSNLVNTLKAFYQKKPILFLGCSIEKDKTLEVLEEILEPGIVNYAIVPCKSENMDARVGELGRLGIRAILYPEGKYEAVRIILEQFLYEIDSDLYRSLDKISSAEAIAPDNKLFEERFLYSSDLYETVGREEEIEELTAFLNESSSFQWYAIIGPGGAGKSRLASTFAGDLPMSWECRYLSRADYEKGLSSIQLHSTNYLFVADYVQPYAEAIGDWIRYLAHSRTSQKIRLLLLEREDGDWTSKIHNRYKGDWLAEQTEYKKGKGFLELNPLSDEALISLMTNYSAAVFDISDMYKRRLESDRYARELLDTLEEIDEVLRRPLYALFLVDLWMQGDAFIKWDREKILDTVLSREERIIEERIEKAVNCNPNQIEKSVGAFLRVATIFQDEYIGYLYKYVPDEWTKMDKLVCEQGYISVSDFLSYIGLNSGGEISAIRPDILGEYYVIRWLLSNAQENDKKSFFEHIWYRPSEAFNFFYRLSRDYAGTLDKNIEIWDSITTFKDEWPKPVLLFITFEIGIAFIATKMDSVRSMLEKRLHEIYAINSGDIEFVKSYAQGLSYYVRYQKTESIDDDLGRLETLYYEHNEIEIVKKSYVDALSELIERQKIGVASASCKKLKEIFSINENEAWALRSYVKGLRLLSEKQKGEVLVNTVKDIEDLFSLRDDEEVALQYIKALGHLAKSQRNVDNYNTIEKASNVFSKFDTERIAEDYAIVLSNSVLWKKDSELIQNNQISAEELFGKYPNNELIAANYAVIVSFGKDTLENAEVLKKIYDLFPNDKFIAELFAEKLMSLHVSNGLIDTQYIIDNYREIYSGFCKNHEVVLNLGEQIIHCIKAGKEKMAFELIDCIVRVCKGKRTDKDAVIILAHMLLCVVKALYGFSDAIQEVYYRLEELEKHYSDDVYINKCCICVNHIIYCIMHSDFETAEKLENYLNYEYLWKLEQ